MSVFFFYVSEVCLRICSPEFVLDEIKKYDIANKLKYPESFYNKTLQNDRKSVTTPNERPRINNNNICPIIVTLIT